MRRYLIYFPLLFLTVSCEIIEEDISGRAVTTIAPADDAEVPAGETLFRWRAANCASLPRGGSSPTRSLRPIRWALHAATAAGYGSKRAVTNGRSQPSTPVTRPPLRRCGSRSPRNPCPRSRRTPNRRTTIRKSLPAKRLLLPECRQKEMLRTFRRVFRPRRLFAVGGGTARARASCSPPQGVGANCRQRRAPSNRRNKTASG